MHKYLSNSRKNFLSIKAMKETIKEKNTLTGLVKFKVNRFGVIDIFDI